jgi:hypothetical protein
MKWNKPIIMKTNKKRKREENDNREIKKPKINTVNKKSDTSQYRYDFCDRI